MQRSVFDLWDYIPMCLWSTEVKPQDRDVYQGILSQLAQDRRRAAQIRGQEAGPFLVINPNGTRPPLLWCFNHWYEPHLLAAHLPDDQPLLGFVSLHNYTERWALKALFNDPIAHELLTQIEAMGLERSVVLAGNCQGAPVVESIALQMAQKGYRPPRLLTIDYAPRRSYGGPLTLLFGEKSRFNPFVEGCDPMGLWAARGMRPQVRFVTDSIHGTYFRKPAVTEVADFVLRLVTHGEVAGIDASPA